MDTDNRYYQPKIHAPHVSVLMPVRNGQNWISQAVDSILAQTYSQFELLIIDDGSVDETPAILSRYLVKDSRIGVIRQDAKGLVSALNFGLQNARSDLIARIDSDDRALPKRLERQVRYFAEHPQTALLGTWADVIDQRNMSRKRLRPPADSETLKETIVRTNPFIHSSVMFRRKLALSLGGYRSAFEAAEDYDLWLRISEVAEIAILPEVLVQYRRHTSNVTTTAAVRQVFSARLARLSSEARRTEGLDPASLLPAPPDWHLDTNHSSYRMAFEICRVLELADPNIARNSAPSSIDLDAVASAIGNLTSAERKLAQNAIVNLIRCKVRLPNVSRYELWFLCFRLEPWRAIELLLRSK
jgi:Glycosyl transferase family 2